jgi:light-regulated signal transduction histidine kinase (bacteriophytochrome)
MLAEKGFDGICVIRGGMIMRPQHQFADLLGVPADTLTGTDLRKYMAPESQGKLEASCTRQQSGLTAITLLQKNGHPVHTQACCVPCRHEGQPAYIIGFRNIGEQLNAEARLRQNQELLEARVQQRAEELNTRMKEAETLNRAMINLLDDIQTTNRELQQTTTQLEAANQELEAFAYSVSHDLRAPLRAIDGFSQAIEEDYHDKLDDEGRQYLSRVRRASQRMGSLIDDMLQLSRLSRSHMHIETVDLSSMAADILRELQETQPQRQVQWQIQPDIRVSADRHLVRAALTNLLSNAWKFTSRLDLARITFGARREDGDTVCFVQDNGAGFDMTFADKLFGAFQRLHGQEEFSGSGIGLATVKRIIHRHGGQVWATGEPDKGATFYFRLPNSN